MSGGCRHDPAADCTGCRPRQALPGGLVCVTCWERCTGALDGSNGAPTLVELYDDLLSPKRAPRRDVRVTGSGDGPPLPLGDAAVLSRDWIRLMLHGWRVTLAEPKPVGRALSQPPSDDPHVTLPVVSRHAEWLLAHPQHAEQFVYDVTTCWRDAVKTVAPSGPDGVMIGRCPTVTDDGTCGAAVRAVAGSDVIVCRSCGTRGDAATWRRLLRVAAPPDGTDGDDPDRVATGQMIAAGLSHLYQVEITPQMIRAWAWRPLASLGGLQLPRAGKNAKGETLYPVRVAEQIAEGLYAREATA